MTIFPHTRRIVIKVGSSLLMDSDGLRTGWLEALAEDIAALRKEGIQVTVVSSGAVALGRDRLGVGKRALTLAEKQAAAACGQATLMRAWQTAFETHGLNVAQLLLTLADSDNRRCYLNATHTLETLLDAGIVPIVNENDTVATAEIRFGDNDRLAARVAQMAGADMLVLLSDIDGLYTANPRTDNAATHIPLVEKITPEIEAMAGGTGSSLGSGGMVTKLAAAHIASASGCHTLIANGTAAHPLEALRNGAQYTLFKAGANPDAARKNWLAHALTVAGTITIDDGAVRALKKGGSLLPAGVTEISGHFGRGDAVSILNVFGAEIGRGLVGYDYEEARLIIGKKTSDFPDHLKDDGRSVLVHRNDMVLF